MRKNQAKKRDVLPDPIYNSKLVTKAINMLMWDGKRWKAQDILYGAFFGCSMLTSISISNDASSIGGVAFAGCVGLISFNIPLSVQSLDEYVFSGSDALIKFDGTKAQWNAIKKKLKWKDGSNIQTIDCTDGVIRL